MLSEGSITAICTCIATITALYFQNKRTTAELKAVADKNAEESKLRSEDLKVAVDGKITTLIEKVESEGVLKVQIAGLAARAEGKEEGEAKAHLAGLQRDHQEMVRAIPPNGPKIEAGSAESKIDSIKGTGEDTNRDVKEVKVELDKKKDKS